MQQRGGGQLQSRVGQSQLTQGQSRTGMGQQGNPGGGHPPNPQKRARWFVALFDYDPATMSPNPDACDEELPFSEGDTIKVWGDKDADGFYWGECRGRRGYVPHNMVMELEGNQNRDRWGDIYANMPVKGMVALYDYDPQELSPNVDAEQVELSFTTGQIINVYGEMDDDGFYMAEIDGVRGLVPSNFLTEAPDQYGAGQGSRGSQPGIGTGSRTVGGRVGQPGPGARGPPPPPRERQGGQMQQAGGQQRNKDACLPVYTSQLDSLNTSTTPNTLTEHQQGRGRGLLRQGGNQQQQQQGVQNQQAFGQQQTYAQQRQLNQQNQQQYNQQNQQFGQQQNEQFSQQQNQQSQQTSSLGSSLFSSLTGQTQQGQQQGQTQQQTAFQSRIQHKGVPQVLPTNVMGGQTQPQPGQPGQQGMPGMPGIPQGMPGVGVGANVMQKLNEITAPGGDILSKGKELIFMKFGLGGK
nr:unnamed protein product [Callosobruchus chinensis]